MGILIIVVLAAALGILAYLKHQEIVLNGSLPTWTTEKLTWYASFKAHPNHCHKVI